MSQLTYKNNFAARLNFDRASTILYDGMRNSFPAGPQGDARCKAWVAGCKLTQSEVRLETTLSGTNNTLVFGVTPNQANSANQVFKTENRLNLQDTLIVADYGIFVANPANADDVEFELFSYGNPIVFTGGSGAAIDGNFFTNGKFLLKVNNDVVIPYRGLRNHLNRNQTQQTAAFGAGSPQDQIDAAVDGYITMEPNVLLIGSKNNQPQIELPGNLSAVLAGSRAVIIFRGILAQNSTIVN